MIIFLSLVISLINISVFYTLHFSHNLKFLISFILTSLILMFCYARLKKKIVYTQILQSKFPTLLLDYELNILSYSKQAEELIDLAEGKNFSSYVLDSGLLAEIKDHIKRKQEIQFNLVPEKENNLNLSISIEPCKNLKNIFTCYILSSTEQRIVQQNESHAQKMQAVGQLAGGIAHDFNNLLTAMIGFCDLLLLKHPPGDNSFADIMQIKQNGNRAANLVKQLLAFSRKQVLKPEILDITNVISESSNLIRRLIGENIDLQIKLSRDLKLVKVDQGQLEQVIVNLAVNARDAMNKSGTLTIETSNAQINEGYKFSDEYIAPVGETNIEDGDYVLIRIVDTGSGIPKEIQNKIFEPFFSTKAIGEGTGLGLSTVYGIVKQTGGYIFLKSAENKGTEFLIYLKSIVPENEEDQALNHISLSHSSSGESIVSKDLTGQGTILLVEDEVPVRMFSAQTLISKGYDVIEADSGEYALKILEEKEGKLDLIVTDVIMPGMNGIRLAEEVRKRYPGIKIIFMSGYTEDAFMDNSMNKDKVNFLPKPFTLKQLAEKVKDTMTEE